MHGALGFLLSVLSSWTSVLSQVFPPIPMKPIYSFHTQIKTKHLLLPSEEKPCPAYITPLKSKSERCDQEMIWCGEAKADNDGGSITAALLCCRWKQSPSFSCSAAVTSNPSNPHPTPHFSVGLTGLLLSVCPQ